MIEEKPLRKLDLVAGAGLSALGIAIIANALQMPIGGTYGGVDNPWYASPAAMPLLIGSALLICAATIIVQALARSGAVGFPDFLKTFWQEKIKTLATVRALIAWGGLLVYALLLQLKVFAGFSYNLRNIGAPAWLADPSGANYVLCSFLFLFGFILAFYRPQDAFPSKGKIALIAAGSLGAALAVGWIFSELLRVPLP